MATSRLRKAFHYPSEETDSDNDSGPLGLDEEEQDQLIASLRAHDAAATDTYRLLFLCIPLSSALFFLFGLLTASSMRHFRVCLLALTSLCCSAYALWYLPIRSPERKGKRPLYQVEAERGPVERYLVGVNAALAALALLAAVLSWRRGATDEAWREGLPAVIFALTLFVRQQLAPVDLEDLQMAKYDLKGA